MRSSISTRFSHLVILFTLLANTVPAQERCATVPYEKMLIRQGYRQETEKAFEEWLKYRLENRRAPFGTGGIQSAPYQIPVVIHVIHKGEALGTGVNISDAQILSQLSVLNKDFNRLNTDASSTPAEFLGVAGSLEIEFILAKRNPEGVATTAINRKQGSKSTWSISDNYELKSQSYWPAEDFLNIWVTDLSGGYLGYAQTPVSSLPGMENSSNNRLTDGVVVDYRAFGSIDDGPFNLDPQYNKGRTLTHEMAHFLGVRHIWGDDEGEANECGGTDYVDDTPNQAISTSGCPAHPRATCSSNDMFQNYLDYTNDACMNLFTIGQIDRMVTVLENSPRRNSLTVSPALLDPVPLANDMGIKEVVSPSGAECSTAVTPAVLVQNYGTNLVSTVRISFTVDNVLLETRDFPLALSTDQEVALNFTALTLTPGNHTVRFEILLTNGGADSNSGNNTSLYNTVIASSIATPFDEPFATLPAGWTVLNPDQLITWANKTAPASSPSNKAMYINFYDYEDSDGESDVLLSPVFDLSAVPGAYLSFDVAYAQFPGSSDGLRVYVLTDCEGDLFEGVRLYEKFGSSLASTTSTSIAFTPSNQNQWRTETLSLNDFVGTNKVQLAFVGVNDWGNNLYIDNVRVITDAEEDLVLRSLARPSVITCDESLIPTLLIENGGDVTITSYKVRYEFDDDGTALHPVTTSLAPGASEWIELPAKALTAGTHELMIELIEPNGKVDIIPANSQRHLWFVMDQSEDHVPMRVDFETAPESWVIINPADGNNWQSVGTNLGTSQLFDSYSNTTSGDQSWLITPELDLTGLTAASVFFEVSYARGIADDSLLLMATTDCGLTFDTVAHYTNETLSEVSSVNEWYPTNESDWATRFVDLSAYAGERVRFAWLAVNANGNNLFIDNIEFFQSDDPNPPTAAPPFLIYNLNPQNPDAFTITFNLQERMPVGYEVIDLLGRTLTNAEIGYVLNQTFEIDAGGAAAGLYIVRIRVGDRYYSQKVYLDGN